MNKIIVKGAKEHNLKNINVVIPKNQLTVITGLSGSGKSSLAFDTLYAEGQRRYVESLSSYARQFLGLMSKPDVLSIEGLSPAISIEQKTTSKNPRSTVGTVTEIYDYLRLFFARIGTPHCPDHNIPIQKKSPEQISKDIFTKYQGKVVTVLAPIVMQKKGTYEQLIEDLKMEGYTQVRINKKMKSTEEKPKLERYKKHDIELIVDKFNASDHKRLNEAVEIALKKGNGLLIILNKKKDELFSEDLSCPECGLVFEELQPRMFSFNSPFGACGDCHGIGFRQEVNPELVIPHKNMSIADGAIKPYGNAVSSFRGKQLAAVAKEYGFSIFDPINKLTKKQLKTLLYGSDHKLKFEFKSKNKESEFNFRGYWEGVVPNLRRLYKETKSDYRRREIEKFMSTHHCSVCNGKRLKRKILSVKVSDKNIIEITNMSISDSLQFFKKLELGETDKKIVKQVTKEIKSRLSFLKNVGLNYLTLSRSSGTLSGGEAQRIRLATQIGANLTGVIYVLDEPSIGLHQKDNDKLIKTLLQLRDIGNTLIVVEHDEETILAADHVLDLGPGAGIHGGHIVSEGTPKHIIKDPKSLTGQYLSGKKKIAIPKTRREPSEFLRLNGVTKHNLKNLDVEFPTDLFTVVTGVSGSGKSTLIYEVLHKVLKKELMKSKDLITEIKSVKIPNFVRKVIMIDQSPIGRTPRSNPATYTKVFDDIRTLFAATRGAKLNGYKPGRFSFNVSGGRCENCRGDGLIKIEMHFLPDVYVTCEECKGKRYNEATLDIDYKGKNISEILNMSVDEALTFFENIPLIRRKLKTLYRVGLGYIKLGQPSTTLSGGEAQRIKITRELAKKTNSKTIYLLDEPTTGLHFDDVNRLVNILQELVKKGNTVIVIEHNLDIIKNADYLIDLGPEGGEGGGKLIASGTPEKVAKISTSYTGQYLRKVLGDF
ncbi:MAG: excinuclease ABC subunit UvrA [Candidatus Altiarchaeota archaeon]|nr:excinuclease ABC subunit UvrA [Candidatus Altiarchaeota archaeon]